MALTTSITSLSTGTYSLATASGVGTYSYGVYTAPPYISGNITAVVVPISGKDLNLLPEGLSSNDVKTVYTTSALVAADSTNQILPDIITVAGTDYEFYHVEFWENPLTGVDFYSGQAKKRTT